MQLTTIVQDKNAARRAFLEYRTLCRAGRGTAEDGLLMRAYREASRGRTLLRLTDTLREGGVTEVAGVQVPRLCVARADQEIVYTRGIDSEGRLDILYANEPWQPERHRHRRHRVPAGTFPSAKLGRDMLQAMAPVIPPALRPAHHLRNYHLLWEAEWSRIPRPPGDPALLKHVAGDLYAVLAVWDLTPLEQAVLAGTRGRP